MNPHHPVVSRRARRRCEYCRAPEFLSNFHFEVEHVCPISLGGPDDESNLALACRVCNLRKGEHTGGIDPVSGQPTPLFNPRTDRWEDHFQIELEGGTLVPRTAVGRVTVAVLDLNHPLQVVARLLWIEHGLYP